LKPPPERSYAKCSAAAWCNCSGQPICYWEQLAIVSSVIPLTVAPGGNCDNRRMPLKTRGYAQRIDIEAPVPKVWNALCGPTTLPLWLGSDARMRPQAGGSWSATIAPGIERHAMIDVFDPPRRLRLIYLTPDNLASFDGAVADDILLEEEGDTTIVRLLCSGMPDMPEWTAHFSRVRAATERALTRLKMVVEMPARELLVAR